MNKTETIIKEIRNFKSEFTTKDLKHKLPSQSRHTIGMVVKGLLESGDLEKVGIGKRGVFIYKLASEPVIEVDTPLTFGQYQRDTRKLINKLEMQKRNYERGIIRCKTQIAQLKKSIDIMNNG